MERVKKYDFFIINEKMVSLLRNKKGELDSRKIFVSVALSIFILLALCALVFAQLSIDYVPPTPDSGITTPNASFIINQSISGTNINSIIYNWNGTNYTIFDNSVLLMMGMNNLSSLGENDSLIVDNSLFSNNGTAINTLFQSNTGRFNQGSFYFNGANSLVNISKLYPINFTNTFTISMWIQSNLSDTNYRTMISSNLGGGNGNFVCYYRNSIYDCDFRNNTGTQQSVSASGLSLGNWYNFVVTNNGTTLFLYKNGGYVTSLNYKGIIMSNSSYNVLLGGTTTANTFNGSIDEVMILNRTLSPIEINLLYQSNLYKFNSSQFHLYINQSKNFNSTLSIGSYTYQTFITDTTPSSNQTVLRTINIDGAYPTFSGYWDDNNTASVGEIGYFNVTLANTNGTVILNIGGNQVIATNLSANIYNASYQFLGDGVYSYNWTSYGNDFRTVSNSSINRYYNVKSSNKTPDIESGMILYYDFSNNPNRGDNATLITDRIGKNNGTVYQTVFNSTGGYIGGGSVFDGANDYITVNLSGQFNSSEGTVGFWVRDYGSAAYKDYISWTYNASDFWRVEGDSGTSYVVYATSGGVAQYLQVTGATRNTTWRYLVVSYGADGRAAFYSNGVKLTSRTNWIKMLNEPTNLYIGSQSSGQFAKASIDELIVWNRRLSDDEISRVYNRYNSIGECLTLYLGENIENNQTVCQNIYTLSPSASGYGIKVLKPNVTLDLGGSTINGNFASDSIGIFVNNHSATIKNGIVSNYEDNIYVGTGTTTYLSNILIDNVTTNNATDAEIKFNYVNNSIIQNSILNTSIPSVAVIYNIYSNNNIYRNNTLATNGVPNFSTTLSSSIVVDNGVNLSITNNLNIGTDGAFYFKYNSEHIYIANNRWINCKRGMLFQASSQTVMNDFLIENNTANSSFAQTFANIRGFTNVTIRNNVLINDSFLLMAWNITNLEVYNNNLTGNGEIVASSNPTGDSSKDNVWIHDNRWINPAKHGLLKFYGNYQNFTFEDNYLFNNTGAITAGYNANFLTLSGGLNGSMMVRNNQFNMTTTHIFLGTGNISITIRDNIIDDASGNGDSYNAGIHLSKANNINIINNTITRPGCNAILIQGGSNWNIINNTMLFDLQSNYDKKSNCAYEPITAIHAYGIWKTWTTDGTELVNDTIIKINTYNSNNVTILGNNITGFPVILRMAGSGSLTQDFTNYWFVSFSSLSYLEPRTDWYISNDWENASTTFNQTNNNPVVLTDILGQRYPGYSTTMPWVEFRIHKEYIYFYNHNYSIGYGGYYNPFNGTYTSPIYNQTDSLVFIVNGNASCTNITTCDGNINITTAPFQEGYALPNFNLTENSPRAHSPLWIVSKTDDGKKVTYHLASNLTNTVNGIKFYPIKSIPCGSLSATYSSKTSASLNTVSLSCNGGLLEYVTIDNYEPSNDSNTLILDYYQTPTTGEVSSGTTTSFFNVSNQTNITTIPTIPIGKVNETIPTNIIKKYLGIENKTFIYIILGVIFAVVVFVIIVLTITRKKHG